MVLRASSNLRLLPDILGRSGVLGVTSILSAANVLVLVDCGPGWAFVLAALCAASLTLASAHRSIAASGTVRL